MLLIQLQENLGGTTQPGFLPVALKLRLFFFFLLGLLETPDHCYCHDAALAVLAIWSVCI